MNISELVDIAHAAGLRIEQHPTNPPKAIAACKFDTDGRFVYAIPIMDFEAIVSAAQHEDAARLDKLQSMAEDGVVSICFEVDGGIHVTHEPMGGEMQAARDQKDVRAGLDWHITNLTSSIPL